MSTRAGRHSTGTVAEHLERSRRQTVVIVQIEDQKVVAADRDIAATTNVHAVWLGPSDLSMSLGQPRDLGHPQVVTAIGAIVDGVNAASAAASCVLVDTEQEIPAWQQRGASVVLFAATNLLAVRLKDLTNTAVDVAAPATTLLNPTPN